MGNGALEQIIDDYVASDAFHEATLSKGYFHKDDLKEELEKLLQNAKGAIDHMSYKTEDELREERRLIRVYEMALRDIGFAFGLFIGFGED